MTGNENPVGNPVIVSSQEQTAGDDEYQRFESATRTLLKTPKPKPAQSTTGVPPS